MLDWSSSWAGLNVLPVRRPVLFFDKNYARRTARNLVVTTSNSELALSSEKMEPVIVAKPPILSSHILT